MVNSRSFASKTRQGSHYQPQGTSVTSRSNTRRAPPAKQRKTSQSSGSASNQVPKTQAKPAASTQDDSIEYHIGEAIDNKQLKAAWKIWNILRLRYPRFMLAFTILAGLVVLAYVGQPYKIDFWMFEYSGPLLEIKSKSYAHEIYERVSDVEHIISMFAHLTAKNVNKEVHVVISGGPGSGKSELARQFGQEIYTRSNTLGPVAYVLTKYFNVSIPMVDVVTLNAESVDDLQHSIEEILGKFEGKKPLEISYSSECSEDEIVAKFLQLKEAFARRSRRPVIIIDNVRRPMYKILYKKRKHRRSILQPGDDEYGELRILITTQHRPALEFSTVAGYVNLFDGMAVNDAVKLLNAITKIYDDDKNAGYLAKELGGLPFSLANVALYIRSARKINKELSYYHYLKEFKRDLENYRQNIEWWWENAKHEGLPYDMTMATTSIQTIKQLINTEHRDLYQDLACFVGYCDSQTISVELFWQYTRMNPAVQHYTNFSVKTLVRQSSIYELHSFSRQNISVHTEQAAFIYSHQVTREASRIVCRLQGINSSESQKENHLVENSLRKIVQILDKAMSVQDDPSMNQMTEYTTLNFRVVDVLMSLVTHSFRLELNYSEVFDTEFCWKFLHSMSEAYLYWPNKRKSAVVMLDVRFLVNMTKTSFTDGKPEQGIIFSILYLYYTGNEQPADLGKVVELVETYARNSSANTDEKSAVKTSLLLNIMGTVYRGVGQVMRKAQELHELALDISRKFGRSSAMATSLHLLGIVHRYMKNLDKAQEYHETAVELARKIYSDKNPRLGAFLLNLAVVYNRQGELKKANMLYREALNMTKKAYGTRDQRVARVLNTLATNYYKLAQYNESVKVLLEALIINEDIHGDTHPNVAETLYFLGFTYRAKGDLAESLESLKRSLKIRRQYYSPTSYQVAEVLHDLSNTQRDMGSLEDALSNGHEALEIFRKTLGEKASETGNSLNGVGLIYSELGDLRVAKLKHEEALGIFEDLNNVGSQAASIGETLKYLGKLHRKMGDDIKAREYLTRALEFTQNAYKDNNHHPRIQEINNMLH